MAELLRREAVYLWYYFSVQFHQIVPYWLFGMVVGSLVSVFLKGHIHSLMAALQGKRMGLWGILPASALGILSPLCMYGTVPIVAAFARGGMREDWIAAFMMSSILLNPQLLLTSLVQEAGVAPRNITVYDAGRVIPDYMQELCSYGSIMNSNRMRAPEAAGVHRYLTQNRMNAYTVLVDLMANYQMGEKTMLYLLDAIICAPGESVPITGENARWQQSPFEGDYTSSVFFSQDPVALDSVGADFLMNEPTVTSRNSALRENPNESRECCQKELTAFLMSGSLQKHMLQRHCLPFDIGI